jgi:Na+-driven multidrug efflux pump
MLGALGGFVPLCLLSLRVHWGLGGIWCGLTVFIAIRFAGMLWRARGGRWLVTGTALL